GQSRVRNSCLHSGLPASGTIARFSTFPAIRSPAWLRPTAALSARWRGTKHRRRAARVRSWVRNSPGATSLVQSDELPPPDAVVRYERTGHVGSSARVAGAGRATGGTDMRVRAARARGTRATVAG